MNKKTGNFTAPRNELVRNIGAFDSIRKFKNTKKKSNLQYYYKYSEISMKPPLDGK